MFKKTVIFYYFTLFSCVVFSQQDSISFSLQDAIDYALNNNRAVKNAIRDIRTAKKQKWETTARGLPQINADIDYQNWLKQQVSLIPAEFFGGAPGEFSEVLFGTKQSLNASARLEQLLFDGSYLIGLQSAKVFLEISEIAKKKTDIEIKKAVINAYSNVLLIEESIKVFEKNKSLLDDTLYETKKIYENGLTEEEDVEQLQLTLSDLEITLNNSKRLKTLAYQMLNILLGIDLNTPITLKDNLEDLTQQHLQLNLIENIVEQEERNIDYKIALNNTRSKELLLKYEKSKSLPRLSAFINGGYLANSNTFTFTNSNQNWFGFSLVGINLNIPIFSSLERSAATQRARIGYEKSKEELLEITQQLRHNISRARSDYEFAIESYNNKKNNLNLAERIANKNQIKFYEGIATSFDLRQAQTQLYSSQQEYLQSMLNVITKKVDLEAILN